MILNSAPVACGCGNGIFWKMSFWKLRGGPFWVFWIVFLMFFWMNFKSFPNFGSKEKGRPEKELVAPRLLTRVKAFWRRFKKMTKVGLNCVASARFWRQKCWNECWKRGVSGWFWFAEPKQKQIIRIVYANFELYPVRAFSYWEEKSQLRNDFSNIAVLTTVFQVVSKDAISYFYSGSRRNGCSRRCSWMRGSLTRLQIFQRNVSWFPLTVLQIFHLVAYLGILSCWSLPFNVLDDYPWSVSCGFSWSEHTNIIISFLSTSGRPLPCNSRE